MKKIAVLGSPSTTTEMTIDILNEAVNDKLVGSLVYFDMEQDKRAVRATAQITDLEMRNTFHENPAIKNALKMRSHITGVSGQLDIRTATLAPGATFGRDNDNEHWSFDTISTIPPAGTAIRKLDQQTIDELVEPYAADIFKIGTAYGDASVSLPMTVKHFGSPKTGGLGEAYHSLVLGKTGSGKSTLAKYLFCGYARHKDMAILIIDPKGEFADEIQGYAVGDSGLPFRGILKGYNKPAYRYGITQIRLETYELFEDILISLGIDKDLNIRGQDNKEELAKVFVEILKNRDFTLTSLRNKEVFDTILTDIRGSENEDEENDGYLSQIYKSKDGRDSLRKQINKILANPSHRIYMTWEFIAFLFEDIDERPTISQLVTALMDSEEDIKPIIAIDLSVPGNRRDMYDLGEKIGLLKDANEERDLFTDSLQKKILFRLSSELRRTCENVVSKRIRNGDKRNVNTLVVFEEAHRFAPRQLSADDDQGKKLKAKLIEAVLETRKFGLGWFFIDQTIGGIDRAITQQVRCIYVGYGLSMGEELNGVREIVGGDQRDINLYRSFKDPASFGKPSDKKFPWMAFGPVSPMAANRPLFFNAFSGSEFVDANNIYVDGDQKQLRLPDFVRKARKAKSGNVKPVTMDDIDGLSLFKD